MRLMSTKSPYGLKLFGCMWYQRLSEYLTKERYINNPLCQCIFIDKYDNGFAIVAIYIDNMNLVGTLDKINETAKYLKCEFEVKDMGRTSLCYGLEFEHMDDDILVHQSSYIERILKRFNLDRTHLLSTPMMVRLLESKTNQFNHRVKNEEVIRPEVSCLSAIDALMHLSQYMRLVISFAINSELLSFRLLIVLFILYYK